MSFKYLYKIKYVGNNIIDAKYYIGSRKSNVIPENDLLKKYFTSSKIVKRIIEEEGVNVFQVEEIRRLSEEDNILHEECKWLVSVNAKDNPLYFNQTNITGYYNKNAVNKICIHCGTKNVGNPFEKCSSCGLSMIIYKCKKCGNSKEHPSLICNQCGHNPSKDRNDTCKKCGAEINNVAERCTSCGYRVMDDVIFYCKFCGNKISYNNAICTKCGKSSISEVKFPCKNCGNLKDNPSIICSKCGYNPMRNGNARCKYCGNKLDYNIERCNVCGKSRVDEFKYKCPECGHSKKSALKHCPNCGLFTRDKFEFKCQKCGKSISNSTSRCGECGYSSLDSANFRCEKCQSLIKNPMERCSKCNYSRRDVIEIKCKNCGVGIVKNSSSRCLNCGIVKAGCDTWKKFNNYYKLMINGKLIFSGYRENCIDYLYDNLIAEKRYLIKSGFFEGKPFKPKPSVKKYINQSEYEGMIAVKIEKL